MQAYLQRCNSFLNAELVIHEDTEEELLYDSYDR